MMNSKIMIGKDCINKINFECYLLNCKSILVISDLVGDICGAKRKVKKSLGKDKNITWFKLKACEYAEAYIIDNAVKLAKNGQVDLIISIGTHVAHNFAKAVKYVLLSGGNSFVEVCNSSEQISSEQSDVNLICVTVAGGNHQNLLTGNFEVKDSDFNNIYRLNKDFVKPLAVMTDEKVLDKLSNIAKLGMELSALITGLIAITHCESEENKLSAMSAVSIVAKDNVTLGDLLSAEMYAGTDFLSLANNLLNEFVLSVGYYTGKNYYLILLLTIKKSVQKIIELLSINDIKMLDMPYGIQFAKDEKLWKDSFYSVVDGKMQQYYADKDIPKNLNEIGLNSDMIEKIFEELAIGFGDSEVLSKLKDIVYDNY